MKILHVITRLILGGAQQNTVISCAAQVQRGHQVALVYGPIYGPEGSLLEEARKSGARLVEEPWMRRAILPMHDWLCYRSLRRLIREMGPDVVHTHSSKAGIVGRAAAWAEGVPAVIHTIHGLPFHDRQPAAVRRLYIALERWAARRCHHLIGVTEAMGEAFAREGIGRGVPFTMVPSGMDIATYQPPPGTRERVRRELGIAPDALVVGIVARLDHLKGQRDLIEATPALLQRFPQARLLIVGDGWDRPHLEEMVGSRGLEKQVLFTGLVPPARVGELLAAMDVNTLPSYQEGQPRTLVQALLAGIPVVGYEAGGIPEVCVEGKTGRLAPVGDRARLGEAIASLLADEGLRRRLGETGRAYAAERFDHRVMVAKLEDIYRQTLAQSRRPRGLTP